MKKKAEPYRAQKPYAAEPRMIVVNGRLKMKDGSSATAYLKSWQKYSKTRNGCHVTMMKTGELKAMAHAALIGRSISA